MYQQIRWVKTFGVVFLLQRQQNMLPCQGWQKQCDRECLKRVKRRLIGVPIKYMFINGISVHREINAFSRAVGSMNCSNFEMH